MDVCLQWRLCCVPLAAQHIKRLHNLIQYCTKLHRQNHVADLFWGIQQHCSTGPGLSRLPLSNPKQRCTVTRVCLCALHTVKPVLRFSQKKRKKRNSGISKNVGFLNLINLFVLRLISVLFSICSLCFDDS